MKRSQQPTDREQALVAPPARPAEAATVKLRIEEWEPRLAPQSTATILD